MWSGFCTLAIGEVTYDFGFARLFISPSFCPFVRPQRTEIGMGH